MNYTSINLVAKYWDKNLKIHRVDDTRNYS